MILLLITFFFSFLTVTPHGVAAVDPTYAVGSTIFEISDYYFLDEVFKPAERIRSEPFTVGRYQWVVEIYPGGYYTEVSDYVTIKVRLINTTDTVSARATQRLFNWNTSKWSTDTPLWKDTETSTAPGSWGFQKFIKRSDLKASNYLKDGVLRIKAVMWVLEKSPANVTEGSAINQWNVTSASISYDDNKGTN